MHLDERLVVGVRLFASRLIGPELRRVASRIYLRLGKQFAQILP